MQRRRRCCVSPRCSSRFPWPMVLLPALPSTTRDDQDTTPLAVAAAFEGRDFGDSSLTRSFSQHPSLRRTLFALCDQRGSANYSRVYQVAFPPSCCAYSAFSVMVSPCICSGSAQTKRNLQGLALNMPAMSLSAGELKTRRGRPFDPSMPPTQCFA